MYFRFIKGATTIAYLSLFWLTWRFLDGESRLHLAWGASIISGSWLVLTLVEVNRLFRTYFDVFSRLEVLLPLSIGTTLSLGAGMLAIFPPVKGIALIEVIGWISIYLLYRKNQQNFEITGHGPVPAGCWVSPPAQYLEPGDLILTSGQVARRLHESVGHAEMALKMEDNAMYALSSYMKDGLVLNPLQAVASATLEQGHYIVMRLVTPLSPTQITQAGHIAREMLAENAAWKERTNNRRKRVIECLPLSNRLKQKLIQLTKTAGYDWLGLFMGRLAKERWTCIGACLEVYHRLGIKTNQYGTGLLGFGTTLFDPIMPVRFLSDPAFRLLSITDKAKIAAPQEEKK
jgi:hypothetical protein